MPSPGTRTAREQVSYDLREILERFIAERSAAGRSPLTLAMYERTIRELCKHSRCEDIRLISPERITSYVDQLMQRPLGITEKAYWIARLKIFFRWAVDQGLILADPTGRLKLPASKRKKFPPYVTQMEVAHLLDSIPNKTAEDLRDLAALELLYSTGLRSAEFCRLTLNDINFADETVTVLFGKGKKDRVVPIGRTALVALDRYIQQVRGVNASGPLFYHLQTFEPLKGWQLQRQIIVPRAQAAHIEKRCTAKTFRHSFAIHLLENGASIRHIQAMLGHSDLRTTQKYTDIVPAELKRAHLAAHPSEHRRGRFAAADPRHLHMLYPDPKQKAG